MLPSSEESMEKTIDLSRRIEMISVMHEIDRSILSTLEPREILEKAVTMINRLIYHATGSLLRWLTGKGGVLFM